MTLLRPTDTHWLPSTVFLREKVNRVDEGSKMLRVGQKSVSDNHQCIMRGLKGAERLLRQGLGSQGGTGAHSAPPDCRERPCPQYIYD